MPISAPTDGACDTSQVAHVCSATLPPDRPPFEPTATAKDNDRDDHYRFPDHR